MRFLVDQCLSPDFAVALAEAGHDVVHVRDLGMQGAGDPEMLGLARRDDRVLVSADTARSWPKAAPLGRPWSSCDARQDGVR